MQGSLEEDSAALRKLRDDDASGVLKEFFGDGEDPREWTYDVFGSKEKCVTVADGRVTQLKLYKCSIVALPDAIGELGALTRLNLRGCSSLAALPDAIGELGALTTLNLYECTKLTALPDSIGKLGALTTLTLTNCSSLAALPDAIGELGALTTLNLFGCSGLTALPAAIGELGALTELKLDGCSSLTYPPKEMHDNVHKIVGFCCLNLLGGGDVSVADVKDSIVNHVITGGDLGRIDSLASKDSAFAEMTKSARADLAALRKLRDDDESGALKEYFGDGEDPREWIYRGWHDGRVTNLSLRYCSDLAALPDAIGELKALTTLNLYECTKLSALPDAIGELKALTTLNLRECSSLVALPDAIGELGALTELDLYECTKLSALPDAIGELKALTTLNLRECSSLVALPDAIGELGALTELDLYGCSSLEKLPDVVAAREGLTVVLPDQLNGPLQEDFAALRKLRDDDESGALKEFFGDGEDPRKWKHKIPNGERSCVTVADGRVTELSLFNCSSLAALPAAIGELKALTVLSLGGCSSLTALPATIGKLGAMTELCLFKCSSLAALPAAIGELGALTELDLTGCSSLTTLPGAIGELKALTTLNLRGCSKLTTLPAAIGELKALTELRLQGCSSLTELPAAIVAHQGLKIELPVQLIQGPLGEDFAALRKLRDDDASGALKELFGDSEDPREWTYKDEFKRSQRCVTVADGRVTELTLNRCTKLTALPAAIGKLGALTSLDLGGCSKLAALPDTIGELKALPALNLWGCSSLAALPAAIGELSALTTLNLYYCSSLAALPDAIGGLGALTELDLRNCPKLTFPPRYMRDDFERVKRLLANTTRLLANEISAAAADDDAKADFLEVVNHAQFADRLEEAVRKDPALADLTNDKGQRAIELACLECRSAMQKALFFLGRYDVDKGPPEHRSATSLVVRAVDHEAADDYGKLFDEVDDGDGALDANELDRLAAKLGTNVEILKLEDGSLTKDAFVAKCQRLFGKERKVVIKIFQVAEQWRNELKARDDQELDARYVVQTIPAPTDEEFADGLKSDTRFGEGVGTRAIVMDAADRNLFQIYQSERPDLNAVRTLMQQVMECVQHLHDKGLVHGDIKMLNVVRLSLDNRLRLIDLDAAAKFSRHGGDYVCSKFSSAILPPECFAKLDANQVTTFEAYFEDVDAELREKVAPKVDKRGASYVVKTFSLTKEGDPMTEGLPYEPVEASVAVDYWSLGALLFQLVAGEPLVPSNRDDDCVNAKSMAILASWNDDAAKRNLAVIKDAAAWDLASKLLVRDPEQRARFDIKRTLETHPFFHPESGDAEIKKQLGEMQTTLESVKADTSSILRLSEEHRDELRRTREALMRGIYEATEVTTPTAFIIVRERLKSEDDEAARLSMNIKDDGTGVAAEGEHVDRLKECSTWLNLGARFARGVAKCSPAAISAAVAKACEELVVGDEMFLYLIDELTGEPVRPTADDETYPLRITKRSGKVEKLLPAMQAGLHAMSLVNGVAGVVRLFGVPAPAVPEAWREGAATSVEILKQESSVENFNAVHEALLDEGDEKKEMTLRGAALRDLRRLLERELPEFAGLNRIGDDEGTAVWTLLTDPEEVKRVLDARAQERRAEKKRREDDYATYLMNKEAGSDADVAVDDASPDASGDATAAMTATTPAAGGGPAAARALSTLSLGEPATLALRDPPGAADGPRTWWAADVEERIARLERRSVEMRLDRLEASARAGSVEERLAGLEARLAGTDWAY